MRYDDRGNLIAVYGPNTGLPIKPTTKSPIKAAKS